MKRLFVSGGSGFIGQNILESLGADYAIDAPTHAQLPLEDEARVDAYFAKRRYDAIVHAAVKPYHRMAEDTDDVFRVNMAMYAHLKKQVQNGNAAKMLVTGTGSEYGPEAYKPMMEETYFGKNIPDDAGTLSRYRMAEDIEKTPLPIVNLRIFGLYGKYEKHDMRFISSNILRLLFDLPMVMHQDRRFSYLWIDDFIGVLTRFIEQTCAHKTYNVTPDETVLLSEILDGIRAAAGLPDYPARIRKAGLGTEYTGSNTRLKAEFADIAFTPFADTLLTLFDYYRRNLAIFERADLCRDVLVKKTGKKKNKSGAAKGNEF